MIITNKVTMDLTRPAWMPAIDAVQDDRYSRNVEIALHCGSKIWTIPEGTAAVIRYRKADGTGGIYDTLPDGTTAWSAAENLLTIALAPQALTTPGTVFLAVTLTRGNHQLNTFTLLIHVHPAVDVQIAESEDYFWINGFLPAPADGKVGQYLRVASVDEHGHITALDSAEGTDGGSAPETYLETDGVGSQKNPAAPENPLWSQWHSRLAFGMDTQNAPAPFHVGGQLLADGTIIARNCGTQDKNRWGFHVFEAYAKDNYSRMTMLLDKHNAEAGSKPSLELYYYTGSNHHASSYGNTKIGSDVAFHSFCFDRDTLTAYGAINAHMPISLARISLSKDLDTTYKTVSAADASYEPENYPEQNSKCLKFIALRKAADGAMFYDEDRHQVACKINGQWCSLPFTVIEDAAFDILDSSQDTDVAWASGVIDGNGNIAANAARIYTPDCLPASAASVTAGEDYEFCVIPCTADGDVNAPNPYYNPSTGDVQGAAVYYTSADLTAISVSSFSRYKLIARRKDLAQIDPSEGSSIVITLSGQEEDGETVSSQWQNGVIDGNGAVVENAARIYTPECLAEDAASVTAKDGYEFCVIPCTAEGTVNVPNPYYNPSSGQMEGSVVYYTSIDLTSVSVSGFPCYKLIARRTDLASISPSEGENIVISVKEQEETPDTGDMTWLNGIIDGNGNIVDNAARIYTPEYLPADASAVTAGDGYEICLVPYNGEGITNAPNPYYSVETGTFSTTGAVWYTYVDLTTLSLGSGWIESDSEFTNFKLLARRTDLAAINPSEGVNITIS